MNDNAIIESILGSLAQSGYNASRSNMTTMLDLALSDARETDARLKAVKQMADLSIFPSFLFDNIGESKSNAN